MKYLKDSKIWRPIFGDSQFPILKFPRLSQIEGIFGDILTTLAARKVQTVSFSQHFSPFHYLAGRNISQLAPGSPPPRALQETLLKIQLAQKRQNRTLGHHSRRGIKSAAKTNFGSTTEEKRRPGKGWGDFLHEPRSWNGGVYCIILRTKG